jgi:hypothetical protein
LLSKGGDVRLKLLIIVLALAFAPYAGAQIPPKNISTAQRAICITGCTPDARGAPDCTNAYPGDIPGVKNFAKVGPNLYRGARPTAEGFRMLRAFGVTVDVDLEAGNEPEEEAPLARAAGLIFVSLPWHAWPFVFGPNKKAVRAFEGLVFANPGVVFFVHCRQGRDRTGVAVAAVRVKLQGCAPGDAVREMHRFHFHTYLFPLWLGWAEEGFR